MTAWILFIVVPSVIGVMMLLVRLFIQGWRRQGIILIACNATNILALLLLLRFARDQSPDVRFAQFMTGAVIALLFGLAIIHWASKKK